VRSKKTVDLLALASCSVAQSSGGIGCKITRRVSDLDGELRRGLDRQGGTNFEKARSRRRTALHPELKAPGTEYPSCHAFLHAQYGSVSVTGSGRAAGRP
jgi:hypothetical protein